MLALRNTITMVHIVWKGKGWIIAVTTFACCLVTEIATGLITGDEEVYANNPYPIPVALFAAGLLTLYIVKKMKQKADVPDPQFQAGNSLFFIPIIYWGQLLLIISFAVLIYRITNSAPAA